MRKYELTVLIHPDLEIDLEKPLGKVRDIIKNNGGTITLEDNWGKKKLAYRIKKEDFAVYVYFEVDMEPTGVAKLDGTLNITDEVLRHLLVCYDEKRPAAEDAQEKEKSEEGSES